MIVYDSRRQPVALAQPLARGGEAIVYRVRDDPALLAKLYVPAPRREQAAKLAWMTAHAPAFPAEAGNHRLVAWPIDTLHNRRGQFVGYLMPFVQGGVPLLHVYSPKLRDKTLPGFDSRYRYRAARHLASALSALHARGYIVGDLNESNILVMPSALVTLIDTDSFQVQRRAGNRPVLHPCPVGKAEYLPPELQGQSLSDVVRQPEHDHFALAVLIFKLLMDGRHPFQGQWLKATEPPTLEHKIARGWFPHTRKGSSQVAPPPNTPTLDVLPPAVADLLHTCFVDGHLLPHSRPTPDEWVVVLKQAEASLRDCANGHLFASHLRRCPHCGARRAVLPKWAAPVVAGAKQTTTQAIQATPRVVAATRRMARRVALPPAAQQALRQSATWRTFLGMRHHWLGPLTAALLGIVAVLVVTLRGLLPSNASLPPLPILLLTFGVTGAGARALSRAAFRGDPPFSKGWFSLRSPLWREAAHLLALTATLPPILLYGLPNGPLSPSPELGLHTLAWIATSLVFVAVLGSRKLWGWPFLLLLIATLLPSNPLWLLAPIALLQLTLLLFWVLAALFDLKVNFRLPTVRFPQLPRPPRALLRWGVLALALAYFGMTALSPTSPSAISGSAHPTSAWAALPGRGLVPPASNAPRALVVGVAPAALNVRAAPEATAPLVTTLPEGTEVELYDQRVAGGIAWHRIRAGSVEGWASATYLRETSP